MDRIEAVADALQALTYDEMIEMAGHLSAILRDRQTDGEDITDYGVIASLLSGWAQSRKEASNV